MTNSVTKEEPKKKPTMSELPERGLLDMNAIEGARSIHPKISQASNEYDYLNEKVKVQFFNLEQPGNKQKFICGPCTDPDEFTLEEGQIYDLKRAHVRYVETRQIPRYEYRKKPNGQLEKTLIGYSPRFQCRPVWERKVS